MNLPLINSIEDIEGIENKLKETETEIVTIINYRMFWKENSYECGE